MSLRLATAPPAADQLAGEQTGSETIRLEPGELERGTMDLGADVPANPPSLPPPVFIDGHLVNPIIAMPDRTLALDIDEAARPITAAWDPCPSDARATLTAGGLEIAVDLPFIAVTSGGGKPAAGRLSPRGAKQARPDGYPMELVLDGGGTNCTAVPATVVAGPGVIGVLRAQVPPGRLASGSSYVLLLHTPNSTTRLGLDLVIDESGRATTIRSTKVSVIVPAYNAGEFLGDCLGSAVSQSMPREEYEVIVIDDGSSDGTAGLLDWLTTLHPHLRVLHTAHDGHPGGPRNLGLAAARGEYVFFLDATDRLAPDALSLLFSYGKIYGSDIVLGKTTGIGVTVPRAPYKVSKPLATLADTALADSLTPHKLFRKVFLERHGLTFETDHGFEDHKFVAEAYLLAKRIAIYADTVCYYRIDRGTPGTARSHTPKEYAALLRETIDLVEKYIGPGREHTRFMRRWYRTEVLRRLRGEALLELSSAEKGEWFRELRALAQDRFPPSLFYGLPPLEHITAGLLDAGRLDVLERFVDWEVAVQAFTEVEKLYWEGQNLRLTVRAGLSSWGGSSSGGQLFARSDDRVLLDPPLTAAGWTALVAGHGTAPVDVTGQIRGSRVELMLRQANGLTVKDVQVDSQRFDGRGFIATAVIPAEQLVSGLWSLSVRVRSCGWTREIPLIADARTVLAQRPGRRLHLQVGSPDDCEPLPLAITIAKDGSRPVVVRQKVCELSSSWLRRLSDSVSTFHNVSKYLGGTSRRSTAARSPR